MNRLKRLTLTILLGCGILCCSEETAEKGTEESSKMPYARILGAEENPADNGPGDDTELDRVKGTMGSVKFLHFKHASNKEDGFGIPCKTCHHNVQSDDDSSSCSECHKPPSDTDLAHAGAEDNLLLRDEELNLRGVSHVSFNHFTHASAKGLNIPCANCHHKDDNLSRCKKCHGKSSVMVKGKVVPKLKRAFHLQCKNCHNAHRKSNDDSKAPIRCSECHKKGKVDRLEGDLSLERAYHLSCIGCHQQVVAAKPEAKCPTRTCSDCHAKGSPSIQVISSETEEEKTPEPKEQPAQTKEAQTGEADQESEAVKQETSEGKKVGPQSVKIKLGEQGRNTVTFTHKDHEARAESCKTCHHEGMDDPSCTNCHEPNEAKTIFHKLCIDCHKEKSGPNKCSECHPK